MFKKEWSRTPGAVWSLVAIGALVLVLQIPVAMIRDIIGERQATREQARQEVIAAWGGPQSIIGPTLVVPYLRRSRENESGPGFRHEAEAREMVLTPDRLEVHAVVEGEVLRRGIFGVPIYRSVISFTGSFSATEPALEGLDTDDLVWSAARIVVEVSDPRSIGIGTNLEWQGQAVPVIPGLGPSSSKGSGIHGPIGLTGPVQGEFSMHLPISGSGTLLFAPVARETTVIIESDWPDPSFTGNWLPQSRSVSEDGFEAEWSIPFLGRGLPQTWDIGSRPPELATSLFGVDLISTVDHYRMSERSTKYSVLFIALTFGVFWMFEVLLGISLHPIQYLLVGFGLCLFFLLELALGEHVGFLTAYILATIAIVGLVSLYCRVVLRAATRAVIVGAFLASLYCYLYVLLSLEEYALLVGSVGLFGALAAVMYLTRWIDWPSLGVTPPSNEAPESS